MAVNISPLSEAAAKIGRTMSRTLRIDFTPIALANSVRICNITIMVEIASAKGGMVVAYFATVLLGFQQDLDGLSYKPAACHDRHSGWNQPVFEFENPVNFVKFRTMRTR